MTLLQKHGVCLADLVRERRTATEEWWKARLDRHIEGMKAALIELAGRKGQ